MIALNHFFGIQFSILCINWCLSIALCQLEMTSSTFLLLLLQVVHDTFSEACIRITQEERQKMKDLLGILFVPEYLADPF